MKVMTMVMIFAGSLVLLILVAQELHRGSRAFFLLAGGGALLVGMAASVSDRLGRR